MSARVKTPSVITSIRVFAETLDSKRTRKPTVSPIFSPSVQDMRAAAARAARRRGSSTRILRPAAHGSPRSASGTRVVLPAPGGATNTAERPFASAAFNAGSASSTGRVSRNSKGLTEFMFAQSWEGLRHSEPGPIGKGAHRHGACEERDKTAARVPKGDGGALGDGHGCRGKTANAGPGRLGRLRQGLLHRHGGDDALDARPRKGRGRNELARCRGRVRAPVPYA